MKQLISQIILCIVLTLVMVPTASLVNAQTVTSGKLTIEPLNDSDQKEKTTTTNSSNASSKTTSTSSKSGTSNTKKKNTKLTIPKPKLLPGPEKESPPQKVREYMRDVFLVQLTQTLIGLLGGVGFLFLVFGGVQFITAYGNEDQVTAAKKTITWSIAGFIIAMLSYTIVSIIGNIQI